jgi:putative ABC transport system permease protein
MMSGFWQDLRYGFRTLRGRPGFTVAAVLTLALGIGANTAMFSIIHAVLMKPLPFPQPERLVAFRDLQPPDTPTPISYPEYLDWKGRGEIFDDLGVYFVTAYTLTGGQAEHLLAARVSANLLPMLGITPALGRGFRTEDDDRGAAPVVLITDAMWRRRYAADPNVIGRTLPLDGTVFTIVGVLPRHFSSILPQDRDAGSGRDLWMPLRLDRESAPRGLHFIDAIGRLRSGVDLVSARSRAEAYAKQLRQDGTTDHGARLVPLMTHVVGAIRPALLMLLGAVGLVLLVACGNVANLLLARAVARRREISIRMALGASRGRLVRQLLVESLLLAGLGAAAGLLLASWGVEALVAARGDWLPRAEGIRVDPSVLGFTIAAAVLTGLLFGLAPALRASRVTLGAALKQGGARDGVGAGRDRLRGAMVVSEVALSLILLAGAGLLLRSFARMTENDVGFDPGRMLTFRLTAPAGTYKEPQQQARMFQEVLRSFAALPGVEGVAAVHNLPIGGGSTNGDFGIEGRTWPPGGAPIAEKQIVSPEYFQVMRTPLVQGRYFSAEDAAGRAPVAVVNRAFAERFFPGENPIGHRIEFGWGIEGFQEIVGVVGDIRQTGMDEPAPPATYLTFLQRPIDSMTIVLRSAVPPATLLGAARERVRAVDPDLPLVSVRTLDEVLAESLTPRRLPMLLLGGLALLALTLGALGIYGVTSYVVEARTPEIGVRMALGAKPRDVLAMVLGDGMKLVVAGTALGLLGAVALTRLLSGLLYGVGASDPPTFLCAAAFLAVVSLFACYLPARRATRVDPMVALRSD